MLPVEVFMYEFFRYLYSAFQEKLMRCKVEEVKEQCSKVREELKKLGK